jgi:hypothetical protein
MIQVLLADLCCIGLMAFGLGLFVGMFLLGWFEERSDRYDRIPKFTEWEPSPYRFP